MMEVPELHFARRIDEDTIRFERRFAAPPARVWRALVTPGDVSAWLGDLIAIEPEIGGKFTVRFSGEDTMDGRILAFEPERRLVLAWRENSEESLVTFDLAPTPDGGTAFALTHRYVGPGEHMIGFGAGWHGHADALDAWLADGASIDRTAAYERLRPLYVARFDAYAPIEG